MAKIGLFMEFIGFVMLFIKTESLPCKSSTQFDDQYQIEEFLSWIPHTRCREWLSRYWHKIAFGLVALGVLLQFGSCT
jgi:hypothetical protein